MKPLKWNAINPFTGKPFVYDDPNVRWGFYLEPGDPGFVPYPASPSANPKPKPKRMKHQVYYPTSVANAIIWLTNFANKLGGYATPLGLDNATVTAAVADARWLVYVLGTWLPAARAWNQSCTAAANNAQSGDGSVLCALPAFAAPALPAGVAAVNNGALNRIFALVQTIKDSNGYDDSIGQDLQIIGSQAVAPDMNAVQPLFDVVVRGNFVMIDWDWGGNAAFLDMIRIEKDSSDGKGFQFLATDTTPGYTDTTPFPATPTKWTYRAIYMVGDAQVGVWSAPVSVIVGG
jgi:hypothetical protein